MSKSSETLAKRYQTPECEAISLTYGTTVIMSSPKSKIDDWEEDTDDDIVFG